MDAVASRNIKFVGHIDQGGRGDGVQVMVHRGYAYIGHGFSDGISVIDVRDPKRPKAVNFIPCPPSPRLPRSRSSARRRGRRGSTKSPHRRADVSHSLKEAGLPLSEDESGSFVFRKV